MVGQTVKTKSVIGHYLILHAMVVTLKALILVQKILHLPSAGELDGGDEVELVILS